MHTAEDSISNRDYERLIKLIYDKTGICLGTGKRTMLEGRIRRRLKYLSISGYDKYCDYLFSRSTQEDELVQLIDVVTTNKTDFFREPAHFEFLTQQVLPVLNSGSRRPITLWSAGCSSGEEPYTLAMVLSEYALVHPGFRFRILATDISTAVLNKARVGIYANDLARPIPAGLRTKYLMRSKEPGSNRVRVIPELRRAIEFQRLNFMESRYDIPPAVDVIFCRNVIIYFDRQTQQHILSKLTRHLAPGGFLFVGHAETLHELRLPLTPVAPALYQRTGHGD